MQCRIAALLHVPPSLALDLPAEDYILLTRYWLEEPWGAWRDNVHAAIIAREIRRGYMKDRKAPLPIEPFMLKVPDLRQTEHRTAFVHMLRQMAGKPKPAPKPPAESPPESFP